MRKMQKTNILCGRRIKEDSAELVRGVDGKGWGEKRQNKTFWGG